MANDTSDPHKNCFQSKGTNETEVAVQGVLPNLAGFKVILDVSGALHVVKIHSTLTALAYFDSHSTPIPKYSLEKLGAQFFPAKMHPTLS